MGLLVLPVWKVCKSRRGFCSVSLTGSSHQTKQMAKRGLRLRKTLTVLNIVQQGNPGGKRCSLPLWQVQPCLSAWQLPLFQSCTVDQKILVCVQMSSVSTTGTRWAGGRVQRDLHYSSECFQTLILRTKPLHFEPSGRSRSKWIRDQSHGQLLYVLKTSASKLKSHHLTLPSIFSNHIWPGMFFEVLLVKTISSFKTCHIQ